MDSYANLGTFDVCRQIRCTIVGSVLLPIDNACLVVYTDEQWRRKVLSLSIITY